MAADERQKSQYELAFSEGSRGEAPKPAVEGTESTAPTGEPERPAKGTERLLEEVLEPQNLKEAMRHVMANAGSPGVDKMTVRQLPGYLRKHWPQMKAALLAGKYRPQPVRRVEIPKPGGKGMRQLGIPTVVDRFLQQAMLQVLQPRWDPTFNDSSYGFRPGRSAQQAVLRAQGYLAEGASWVVDIDLEKLADRVNHDRLMGQIRKRVEDIRLVKLIRSYLSAGVLEDGLVSPTEEGTPQGGPLSPLLSNLVLNELDRELEARGHRFVRYADDCNIYVDSERAGQRVMEGVSTFIERKLKLKVNRGKSAVDRPWKRKFLGFSFTAEGKPRRRIAPESLKRVRARIRELTRRTRGVSLERMVADLAVYLRGWKGYFGICETRSVLRELDSWVRRRLRCLVWKQWKRGRTRFAELRLRGIGKDLAAQTAGSSHGPWRIARSPALSIALPNRLFARLGLPTLASAC